MRSNFQTELEDDMISEHQLNSSNSSFGLEGPAPSYMSEICKNAKGITRLHYEIYDYVTNVLMPSDQDRIKRKKTVEIINSLVKNFRKDLWIIPYGSYAQELDLKSSDIDIAVFNMKITNGIDSEDTLTPLYEYFKQSEKFYPDIQLIYAKVPIIKGRVKNTDISVDICVNNTQAVYIAETIKGNIKHEPLLQYTIILLKKILKNYQLNEVYRGGMSSFMLFEMVFFFFQKKILTLESQIDLNLGNFLIDFLDYYANKFDNRTMGISVLNGGKTYKKNGRFAHNLKSDYLSVESCLNIQVDLGRYCNYPEIKNMFHTIHKELTFNVRDNCVSFLKEIGLTEHN